MSLQNDVPETDEDVYSIISNQFMMLDLVGKEAAWLLFRWYRNGRYLSVPDAYEKLLQAMLRPDNRGR